MMTTHHSRTSRESGGAAPAAEEPQGGRHAAPAADAERARGAEGGGEAVSAGERGDDEGAGEREAEDAALDDLVDGLGDERVDAKLVELDHVAKQGGSHLLEQRHPRSRVDGPLSRHQRRHRRFTVAKHRSHKNH